MNLFAGILAWVVLIAVGGSLWGAIVYACVVAPTLMIILGLAILAILLSGDGFIQRDYIHD